MKKSVLFLLLLSLLLINYNVIASNLPKIYSPSYILTELSEGTVLTSKDSEITFKPEEFSKLMTAYIISQNSNYDDIITINEVPNFYNEYRNIASLKQGMKFTVKEHLYNMLLLYSDASAESLAKNYSGSLEIFTDLMNKTAKEFGMHSTIYSSPSGYDESNTSKTTIQDQLILTKKIYKDTKLMDIFSTVLFELGAQNGNTTTYSSRNHLISKFTYDKYNYSHANGLMASTSGDKINFIATAEQNGTVLCAIALNCDNTSDMNIYRDIVNLFEYGYNYHTYKTIANEGDVWASVNVKSSFQKNLLLTTDRTIKTLIPISNDDFEMAVKIDAPNEVTPPIKKNQKIGTAKFYYKGNFLAESDLVADKTARFNLIAYINDAVFGFNTFPILIVLILIIVLWFINQSSKRKKKRRQNKKKRILNQFNK